MKSPLSHLTQREASRRFKNHPIEARLDLHGYNKLDARDAVKHFIQRQYDLGRRHVIIITGKGKAGDIGVLREFLPDWLNEPAVRILISSVAAARPEKGGTGVTHVLLKRA